MIKGFFFDLDGTLVDTYRADFLAYRDAMQDVLGIGINEADFAKTHGQELRQKLASLAPGTGEDATRKIAAAKKDHYRKYLHLTRPNKELIGFLTSLSGQYATVLITTAKRDNAMSVLQRHGLEGFFSDFVFGDEVIAPKPDPESYLCGLRKAGLQPNEVLAFEDAPAGIAAAEAAGIAVVQVRMSVSES